MDVRYYLLILGLACSFLSVNSNDLFDNIRVNYKVISTRKDKLDFYILTISNHSDKYQLDEFIDGHILFFQYHAKDSVKMIVNQKDTIKPVSYIFEDNVSGALPYYKQIFGFEKKRMKGNKKLVISYFGLKKEMIIE